MVTAKRSDIDNNLSLDKREGRDASSVNRPMVEELRYDNQNFYHRAA